ncbi:MAG: hypothetical protein WC474_01385 [Hydrogenophilaceae bacterium]
MPLSIRSRLPLWLLITLLAGCGVETVGTAAVAAKAGQEEIRQGQQLQQDLSNKLDAAAQLEQQRRDAAEKAQQ